MHGKLIRVFLPDATVAGIRHAEMANRTGQVVACPRNRLDELKGLHEANRPGVYFLFEARLGDSKPMVYIGESENVAERLLAHDRKKDFWNDVVIFSSKDDNLGKSHVKYLESRLESLAKSAGRYRLENANTPPLASLSRAERETMEELIGDIRLFLGTLGYPILEPLIQPVPVSPRSMSTLPEAGAASADEFVFSVHKLVARGVRTDEGFVLKKGSTAAKNNSDSLNNKLAKLKEQLIADGRLVAEQDHFVLTEDLLMSSSSYAAALIAGTARSGPQSWYAADGRSLKQLEDQAAESATASTSAEDS